MSSTEQKLQKEVERLTKALKQAQETSTYYENLAKQFEWELGKIRNRTATYESGATCPNCQGWGCSKCCSSEAEIRAKQGIFG